MAELLLDKIADYFQPGGPVDKAVPGFVCRNEQVRLAEEITNSFVNREFLVAEVGTGVGKTFAYLLPAFLWAYTEREAVVISTRTKALQQQIVDRDIPDLLEAMSIDLKYIEAKGRENYLCWNKYQNILAGKQSLNESEQKFISKILNWAERTRTGDRKELNIAALMKHWPLLSADRRSCRRDMCPYHEKCFRLKMMKNLHKADIIVVNHALLLSDLQVNNGILPEYKHLIIDEAHNFDRESFDKLSCGFAYLETSDLLHALYMQDKKYARGYLQHMKKTYPNLIAELNHITELVSRSSEILDQIFSILTGTRRGRTHDFSMVIERRDMEQQWFAQLVDAYMEWQTTTRLLIEKMKEIKEELPGQDEEGEMASLIATLRECSEKAYMIMEESVNRDDSINWIEYRDGWASSLVSSHIMIGDVLNEQLYKRLDTLVMVSATLSIENRFDYFLGKTGLLEHLQDERLRTLLEKSPFDYYHQALLCTVLDMPAPNSDKHSLETARALLDVIEATGGGILALFTARKQLQEVSAIIRPVCENKGINLLVQDESGTSGMLLDEFTASKDSVLLGLETFWEGIDVKGDALRCLVIAKLPFRSPSDPFCIAGDKFCISQRKNSFQNFMLPDSAMRFKQGTGRLIRGETDRGVVVVLDNRLENSSYGRVFKNSIPISRTVSVQREDLSEQVRTFMEIVNE